MPFVEPNIYTCFTFEPPPPQEILDLLLQVPQVADGTQIQCNVHQELAHSTFSPLSLYYPTLELVAQLVEHTPEMCVG